GAVVVRLAAPAVRDPRRRACELERLRPARGERRAGDVDGRGSTTLGGANRDELERPVSVGVAVSLRMGCVEALGETAAERHRQLEGLSAVAEVGLALVRYAVDRLETLHLRADSVDTLPH